MKANAEIYLAGGCFWGTEHFIRQVKGVVETKVGYANGTTENPSYREVCDDNTGHAETVYVAYDQDAVPLERLLDLFFMTIDPTMLNRQGMDIGTQYRTGIYYTDQADLPTINAALAELQKNYQKKLVVEVLPLDNFYEAELYHQDYLEKNPGGYCHISPRLMELAKRTHDVAIYQKQTPETLKELLTPLQYQVTQENGTEPAFRNAYWNEERKGIYVDITTGEPLFVSTDKFDSGCGWPSFSRPIDKGLIEERRDESHGMRRVEVRSKLGNAHLGHVFTDGPIDAGGLRYCINSAALRFIPKEEMEKEGYGAYIDLVK